MISPPDLELFHVARDPADAAEHIQNFYRMYHSARYVGDDLVIRLQAPLKPADVERLGHEFADLIASGRLRAVGPYRAERDHLDLPRIAFTHTRRDYGRVRKLIDALNRCPSA